MRIRQIVFQISFFLILGVLSFGASQVGEVFAAKPVPQAPPVVSPQPTPILLPPAPTDSILEKRLIREWDERFYRSAYERAKCIAEGACTWSHDRAKEFVERYVGGKGHFRENLARSRYGNWTWETVIARWDASPTHRDVLNDPTTCVYGAAQYKNIYVLHVGCYEQ